ncbi:MAG: ATP-binding cassette domain-containing protein [Cyclobacteriaceae bacterium]|nr:ATP-binding cassette domain-containing protein [Cyclobacteriaceae bacterium]
MIEIQNISKSFGDKQVLRSISGVFEKGRTNLIIGASGTGKSVLLKCIVELIKPDEGLVFFDNRNFTESNRHEKIEIRREIGMLFQGGALFDSKNVEENVRFPLDMLAVMPRDEKQDRVNLVLNRVGLQNANKKMPSELSGGMRKRVGIARAIVNSPKYLFCDEPNSGLDPQTSILIDELIQALTADYDTTTIVVTHDMNSVMGIGDNIMFLYQGDKLWEGSKDNITHSGVKEVDDFVFANKVMMAMRKENT